ncbi:MAG: ECF-type sigma factor [Beijerinckiaceae bacterium]|nr:ECF-type sigma factor [Beijerinckiaceae bacterium]
MAFRYDLGLHAPRLYRFARALVSGHPVPCTVADDLMRSVLLPVIETPLPQPVTGDDLRLQLFRLLIVRHRERLSAGSVTASARVAVENFSLAGNRAAGRTADLRSPCDKLASQLLALGLEEREALLLVVLEGFNYAEAAMVLNVSRDVVVARLARAREALSQAWVPEPEARPGWARPAYLRLVK